MNVTIKVTDDGGTLHLLDLYEFSAPKLTYQFYYLRSASSSLAGYSSTFRIPATSGNVALFGPLQDPAASTDYLTKRKKLATVEVDTVPVFTGFMRLARVVVQRGETHEFEVTLFGEVSSLAKALGDATLADCDFSAYDHPLSRRQHHQQLVRHPCSAATSSTRWRTTGPRWALARTATARSTPWRGRWTRTTSSLG